MVRAIPDVMVEKLNNEPFVASGIFVYAARLDRIHPEISGNKLFKLYYFIQACLTSSRRLVTFGGAWSNHLLATAALCHEQNIECIGVIRGEAPSVPSYTLQRCRALGMELVFVTRDEYRRAGDAMFTAQLKERFGDFVLVPEGGFATEGVLGASLITSSFTTENFTHICTAAGTAVTTAGLLKANTGAEIIAVPVLKNMNDIRARIALLGADDTALKIFDGYHFGGYAKYTPGLIRFMNAFFLDTRIPTDFVYTAKMFFSVADAISKNYFPEGSRVLCLHTGGLQGNKSLPVGTLCF